MRSRGMLLLSLLLLVVLSTACANLQDQQRVQAGQQADEFCRQLYVDTRMDPIRGKVPINTKILDPIPMQLMAIPDFPTAEEKSAILAWAEQRQRCFERQTELLGQPPAHVDALRRINSQVMAELYAGKITYGQYSKLINQNISQFLQQDQALAAQEARDQLDAQRAFAQQLYQQQHLNLERQRLQNEQRRANQPQSIRCNTQYIGNQAYTNCN